MDLRRFSQRAETSCSGRSVISSSRLIPSYTRSSSALARLPRASRGGALVIECKDSRIGKQPVKVPDGVTVTIKPGFVSVKGQKGELHQKFNERLVEIQETEEKGTYSVKRRVDSRQAHMTHGLVRALFANMTEGLSTGFTKTLTLIGVGYRAFADNKQLTLNLGFSNPVVMQLPEGVEAQVERATTLHIRGYDKCAVGQFAADVRAKRPPEPYKGKGVRYADEFVRKKEGKRGKK